jgi:DNA-binding response OmpR family regulator
MIDVKPHILLVDDDLDSCELIAVYLRCKGFDASYVNSASEALNVVRSAKFQALLIDNWMPVMTGVDLCRAIRVFDQQTPIIFVSAAARESDAAEAASAGAQRYLTKPFNPDDLLEAIHEVMVLRGAAAQC